ncbi:MAG: FkbM family methyltransferase [Planctomycetota bacterium]|nr:FkbM family methyltransferase [Planctomycetota bacterium]
MVLKKILKKLGSLKDPRAMTLDEWIESHRPRVEQDVARIVDHVPAGGTFVDVGANVGLFTETLLKHRPGCKAFLFEPVKRYFEVCSARFADNPDVTVFPYAVGPEPGPHRILKAKYNYGGNSMVEEVVYDDRAVSVTSKDARSDFEPEDIEVVDFSEFAVKQGIGEVDFVKTDTEGYDFAVLTSMLPWLRERTQLPFILSELLSRSYHPWPDQQDAVMRSLFDIGYEEMELPDEPQVFDLIFVPRAQATDRS